MANKRRFASWLLTVMLWLACPGAPRAQSCLPYDEYAHWVAGLPVGAQRIAFDALTHRVFTVESTGTVSVLDLSDPHHPREVFRLDNSIANPSLVALHAGHLVLVSGPVLLTYAVAADGALVSRGFAILPYTAYPQDLAFVGDTALIVSQTSGVEAGSLVSVDLSDLDSPSILGSVPTGGWRIAIAGNLAYVANFNQGLLIYDVSDPAVPQSVGSFLTADSPIDVIVSEQLAYVFTRWGLLQVVDVADPASCREVARAEYPFAWEDAHGTKVGDVIYRPASGLVMIDVSNPAAPAVASQISTENWPNDVTVHDGFAFLGGSGLDVLAVPRPDKAPSWGARSSLGYTQAVSAQGSLACALVSDGSLCTVDVSLPQTPAYLATLELGGLPWDLALQASYAYVVDHEQRLAVVDVGDPARPQVVGALAVMGQPSGIAVRDTLACVASGGGGMAVVSISRPTAPRLLGVAPTTGFAMDVAIDGDIACVADYFNGLFVFDIADPASPELTGSLQVPGNSRGVAYRHPYAYVAAGDSGMVAVDVSDPVHPSLAARLKTQDFVGGLALAGPILYLADGWAGVQVVDVSSPGSPAIRGNCGAPGTVLSVAVAPQAVLVADGGGLWTAQRHCDGIVSVAGPEGPRIPEIVLTASPNPFNPYVTVGFDMPRADSVRLVVYDMLGRRVRTLLDGPVAAGRNAIVWDGLDEIGRPAPSGAYFCEVRRGGQAGLRKLTLVR